MHINEKIRRNCFISYHHNSNFIYLKALREKLINRKLSDYGFKDDDLGEDSKFKISKKIQYRIWSSSITIVLIGEKTGGSAWIDWEIWYSLQHLIDIKVTRRVFKPKGLIALYLPVTNYNIPERLKANIESGYAIELNWDQIESLFDHTIEQAYANRKNLHLIRNKRKLTENPRKFKWISI